MTLIKANKWKKNLEDWSIPKEIIERAEESPWIHPPILFQLPTNIADTFSHQIAREALPVDGSILDIGCGGGIAAFALTGKVKNVIGVDHQSEMLTMFNENAKQRGINSQTFVGFWPEMAKQVPSADVVTCHHVVYNVQEIVPFLLALNDHATKRVVIEMPAKHPLANMDKAWSHFWQLARPSDPTPQDLVEVLDEIGIKAFIHFWSGAMRQETDIDQAAEFMRIRLCLPKNRLNEVKDFLTKESPSVERELATIWWDKI
jgi:SAM-dependent methyltransferase